MMTEFWVLWQEMESSVGKLWDESLQALARWLKCQAHTSAHSSYSQAIAALGEQLTPRYRAVQLSHLCQAQWQWHAHTNLSTPPPQREATGNGGVLRIPVWVITEFMLPKVQGSSTYLRDEQKGKNKAGISPLMINETWFCWVTQSSILLTNMCSSQLFKYSFSKYFLTHARHRSKIQRKSSQV